MDSTFKRIVLYFFISVIGSWTFKDVQGNQESSVVVSPLFPEESSQESESVRTGVPYGTVYICTVNGGDKGLCTDTGPTCTSQGGRVVGYCFYNNAYEGVCCTGLKPSASLTSNPTELPTMETLPTVGTLPPMDFISIPPIPPIPGQEEKQLPVTQAPVTGASPPVTIPEIPQVTLTTPALPTITLTTNLPTITIPTINPPSITTPVITLQPLPQITSPNVPSVTVPSVTIPTVPEITSPNVPSVTPPTVTQPAIPQITSPNIPSVTAPTVTIPTVPQITSPNVPSVTVPSVTVPTVPEITSPNIPSVAPPTVTQPTLPQITSPNVPSVTVPSVTVPTVPEITSPNIPSVTPPTVTQPTLPQITSPNLPSVTPPSVTLPAIPELTSPNIPSVTAPTITIQVPQVTSPSVTLTVNPVTLPNFPPVTFSPPPSPPSPPPVTFPNMTYPPYPTYPTFPAADFPTAPTFGTIQPITTQTYPTLPPLTLPTLPAYTVATLPTMTWATLPPTPSAPTLATFPPWTWATLPPTPSAPTLATLPPWTWATFPPTPSAPTLATFPPWTWATLPPAPTLASLPPTPSAPTLATLPPWTWATLPPAPSLATWTWATLPSQTLPAFPGQVATSEPEHDVPQYGCPPSNFTCNQLTDSISSTFSNPSYPSLDTEPSVCEYDILLQPGYCALRILFEEAILAGKNVDSCTTDSVQVINTVDSPTAPLCGLLQGYQYTVRGKLDQPIKILVTAQSSQHLWSIQASQIKCSKILPLRDPKNCGIKNPKSRIPASLSTPTFVSASKLLTLKKRSFESIYRHPTNIDKLLQRQALAKNQIKIIRGNETGINEWPWQVLLTIRGTPICGGSLINDEWILTAAHCVNLPLRIPLVSAMTVDLGDHDLRTVSETRNQIVRVSRIVPNIQYEPIKNDLALIKLATKVRTDGRTIRPVCLPHSSDDSYVGDDATTTGWGKTENAVISPVLREARVKVIDNEQCRARWATLGQGGADLIGPGMVCIDGGDAGPCNGDSGGPLVVQEGQTFRLIGLTSFGLLRGCAMPGVPSVYTRISSYLDWIALNTAAP